MLWFITYGSLWSETSHEKVILIQLSPPESLPTHAFFHFINSLKNKLPQSLLLVGAEMFSCDESKFYEAHSTCIIFFLLESINGKFHAT